MIDLYITFIRNIIHLLYNFELKGFCIRYKNSNL